MPLDDDLAELEDAANDELDEAIAIGDSYGVRVLDRLVRARSAGPAIVDEAERRGTEIIVHRLAAEVPDRHPTGGLRAYRRLRAPSCPVPGHGQRGAATRYRRDLVPACDPRLLGRASS